ncbi:N-acetylmuramoyl-L-alanine amidase [Metaclostridioides mangenotii]|uniref:N-acetylmuramoyl-L-alanine amidase n=1 Tax=Metaclostridioides mangenotii TaxID=1540 RepID=UPI0028E812B8|nr:N-acetylmuramoyl-L-alanine amidase [Clostridioides mangenotii]
MKICVSIYIKEWYNNTSSNGIKNEYNYNKSLAPIVVELLKEEGHTVKILQCPEKMFNKSTEEAGYKLYVVNSDNYDLLMEFHLNASNGKGYGAEVWYTSGTGGEYANRICDKLHTIGFKNRGKVKDYRGLYMLQKTKCPAVVVESFFCVNKNDCNIADNNSLDKMAKAIVEGVLNKNVAEDKKENFENAIIYSGDRDKAVAIVMKEFLPNSTIVDVADYKSYMCRNAYAIGGGASKGLEKFPDNVTRFVGSCFRETYELVVQYLKDRKKYF